MTAAGPEDPTVDLLAPDPVGRTRPLASALGAPLAASTSLPAGLVDEEGIPTQVNPAWTRTFGEVPLTAWVADAHRTRFLETLALARVEPERWSSALVSGRLPGREEYVDVRVWVRGGDDGHLAVVVDPELALVARVDERLRQLTSVLADRNAELSRALAELRRANEVIERLGALLPICASCQRIRTGDGLDDWADLDDYLAAAGADVTHGMCHACVDRAFTDDR